MLELPSPNRQYTLIFSRPMTGIKYDGHDVPWRVVSIRDSGGSLFQVTDLRQEQPGSAIFPLPDHRNRWSPDGRFILLVTANRVARDGGMDGQAYSILDMEEGIFVNFENHGEAVNTSTFMGWKAKEPHTVRMLSSAGQEVDGHFVEPTVVK